MPATWCAWKRCASRCASSEQALDKLPYGPVRSNNRKFVPPPRSELGVSMEAVIHHFKLWTEGFHAAARVGVCGDRIAARRAGRLPGRRWRPKPYRVHCRTPSFVNLQILPLLSQGPSGGRPGRDHRQHRHCPGRCVTGERTAADKYPDEIAAILAKYPPDQRRSAVMPLLYLAQREHGYLSPQAIWPRSAEIVRALRHRCGLAGGLLHPVLRRAGRAATACRCAPTCPARCAGRRSSWTELCENLGIRVGETTPDGLVTRRGGHLPGRLRPGADVPGAVGGRARLPREPDGRERAGADRRACAGAAPSGRRSSHE